METDDCAMCGDSTGRPPEDRLKASDGYGPLCLDCWRIMEGHGQDELD